MCGDTGIGAMAEVDTIISATLRSLNLWESYTPSEKRYNQSKSVKYVN